MTPSKQAGFGKTDALLLLMALIWGINFSVVKYGTQVFTPLAFTGQFGLAAVVLLAVSAARKTRRPNREEMLALIALGVLGNGLYQILFVEGIARTRVGNAALIVAATPAFIAIIGRIRGSERISRNTVGGIALSLVGVGLVVLGSATKASGEATLLGTMLVFGGTLCWTASRHAPAIREEARPDSPFGIHDAGRHDYDVDRDPGARCSRQTGRLLGVRDWQQSSTRAFSRWDSLTYLVSGLRVLGPTERNVPATCNR